MKTQGICSFVLAALFGMLLSAAAHAAILEVQFTGVNLTYDGANLCDAGASNIVGMGSPSQADPLSTMVCLVDGAQVGSTLTSDILLDTYIKGLTGIPAAGGMVTTSGNGNGFGVDLLTHNTSGGWGLALQIDKFQFFYSGNKISVATTGQSTSLYTQSLPYGLQFDPSQPIFIVLSSANLTDLVTENGYVKSFHAAGTGNISGTLFTPEPTTLLLLGLGGLVMSRARRR